VALVLEPAEAAGLALEELVPELSGLLDEVPELAPMLDRVEELSPDPVEPEAGAAAIAAPALASITPAARRRRVERMGISFVQPQPSPNPSKLTSFQST
jgi:hypothetical protein